MIRTIITAALIAATVTPALSAPHDDPPDLRLGTAYAAFAHVKWCHEVREGYAYQAISAAELERAQAVVKAVAAQSTKADPSIDTDKLWKMGLQIASRNMEPRRVAQPGFAAVCQDVLRQLYELSPSPVYPIAKP